MLQRFRAVFGRHSGFYAPLKLPFKVVTVMEAVMRSNKGQKWTGFFVTVVLASPQPLLACSQKTRFAVLRSRRFEADSKKTAIR